MNQNSTLFSEYAGKKLKLLRFKKKLTAFNIPLRIKELNILLLHVHN